MVRRRLTFLRRKCFGGKSAAIFGEWSLAPPALRGALDMTVFRGCTPAAGEARSSKVRLQDKFILI